MICTEAETISACMNAIKGSGEPRARYLYSDTEAGGIRVDAVADNTEPKVT